MCLHLITCVYIYLHVFKYIFIYLCIVTFIYIYPWYLHLFIYMISALNEIQLLNVFMCIFLLYR